MGELLGRVDHDGRHCFDAVVARGLAVHDGLSRLL